MISRLQKENSQMIQIIQKDTKEIQNLKEINKDKENLLNNFIGIVKSSDEKKNKDIKRLEKINFLLFIIVLLLISFIISVSGFYPFAYIYYMITRMYNDKTVWDHDHKDVSNLLLIEYFSCRLKLLNISNKILYKTSLKIKNKKIYHI